MRKFKQYILLCWALGLSALIWSQDCDDPIQLCAESTLNEEVLDNLNTGPFNCITSLYTSIYGFTTNNINTNSPYVEVSFSNISCAGLDGANNISAAVVSYDQEDPCNTTLYSLINTSEDCETDTLDFSLVAGPLMPSTTYFVLVGTDHDPLEGDCSLDISIYGPPVDIDACCDQQILLGDPADMTVIGGDNTSGEDYTWSGDFLDENTGSNITVFPELTTTYIATGSVAGCTVTDNITIFIGPPIRIPNAITPNGDGINDLWTLSGISRFESAQVTVFDRWGQVVFKSIGYSQPWDGTNRGKNLPTGTFYYVIELNSQDVNIEPLVGFVAIIH